MRHLLEFLKFCLVFYHGVVMRFLCGMLIAIGIKYMMSTASEKANLKGKFTAYTIGVVLIFMCSTIAGAVANIGTSMGNGGASGVIDVALGLVDSISGEITQKAEQDKEEEKSKYPLRL